MAEEDLIFGKNRHLFGGIEPSNMRAFSAISSYLEGEGQDRVEISATLPLDTTVDNQQLCTVAGAVIRKSTEGYPVDEFAGTFVDDITEDSEFYDTDVIFGQTYYYAAFPYTKQGVYNRGNANRAVCTVSRHKYLFGYDLDETDSNPDTRVSYPLDVDNAEFTKAGMNFGTGVFDYGGWPSVPGDNFMPKPCMLTYAGVVDHYLNPNDYTKKEDGSASSVASGGFGGNAMMEWPKIFTKRWTDVNGIYHFRCCDMALDDDYECWTNYDKNNNEIDHFYTPIYFGSSVGSRLRSISGQTNKVSITAEAEITLAKANGDDWYTEVLADRLLIQDLLVMMAKTTDCQTAYGAGRSKNGNTSAIGQGTMNTKGLFWGHTNGTDGVKVFGMENWWGNIRRRIAGCILIMGMQMIVKITRGTKDGSTVDVHTGISDYNLAGNGYKTISGTAPSGTSGGYIDTMKTEPFGRLPVTANGSSSTYEADGMYYDNSGVTYAVVGGTWFSALLAGPFFVHLGYPASSSNANIGAALSCKPLA